MQTTAVLLDAPKSLGLAALALKDPDQGDLVVDITHSGISTGTEKLFWSGEMPPFPGMGFPLVPGYEAVGHVVDAHRSTGFSIGERVFVPGAACYREAHGLFGGAASRIVTAASRAVRIDAGFGADGALLALAATAFHAMTGAGRTSPDLIVGHGTLGRLLARLTLAAGAPAPTVWDVDAARADGATGYEVVHPAADPRRDYRSVYDASGDAAILDDLIGRIVRGGEIVLAGFYSKPLSFVFPPAFVKEARLRISAEWTPDDLAAVRALVEDGRLSLEGLVTHERPAASAPEAYATAFGDPACLKMILNWEGHA